MKKLINHFRAIFAIAIMLCVALPTLAYDFEVDGIYYNITDATAKTVEVTYKGSSSESYNEYSGSVIIPSSVTYSGTTYSVTSIGEYAFRSCTGLTSVTIPNSVTTIGDCAFFYCDGLTSVTIPNSVTSIGSSAFGGCTGLTSVTIPNSLTSIGSSAFGGCTGLTSVTIPNSLTAIGFSAFYGCTGLKEVNIADLSAWCKINFNGSSSNPLYYAGILKLNGEEITNLVIPNNISQIKDYAFSRCTGLNSVSIPNSITSIGEESFMDCTGLTKISIPNSVTYIGNKAFYGTPWFESMYNEHEDGLFYLGNILYAYKGTMPENTSIKIADGTSTIGNGVFSGCSGLTLVTIPNSVTLIGESAFYNCTGLTSITIPNSVTKIGSKAFYNCSSVRSIVLDDDNMYYDSRNNCNAIIETTTNTLIVGCKNSIIPFSLTKIGDYAFYGCSGLKSITIPNSIKTIGDYAFYGCSGLTSITIPNSVTSIGESAFRNCMGLTTLTIPQSVTSIGLSSVEGCGNLASINVESGNKVYDSRDNCNAIIETSTNTLVSGCKNTIIPNSVTEIGKLAFIGCSGLISITIPNSITKISRHAFANCKGLKEITIPNSVTEIGDCVFMNCEKLVSITIPNSVSVIGTQVFDGCIGLTEINYNAENCSSMGHSYYNRCPKIRTFNIGNDVKTIPRFYISAIEINYNAENCTSTNYFLSAFSDIETLNIGNNVKSIPEYAFSGCPSTTKVNYNAENCTSIGSYAFSGAGTLNIGNNVKTIPDKAFYDCSSLTNITIGNSVTYFGLNAFTYTGWYNNQANGALYLNNYCLGYKGDAPTENLTIKDNTRFIVNNAFDECSGLTSVTIPSSVTYIGESAFDNCGLRVVYSYNMTPPTCADGAFGGDTNSSYSARLMIPEGTYYAYIEADEWYKFDRIQEIAGVETIEADNNTIEVARYDIHGKLISEPTKGVNIVKYSDGTTRKEFVK